ncbi:hypothetical protein Taro_010624 [Colocasia esculenta]|uniref:Uncharacterized protein n=1 Tax=Colocasia esculenta TaxID=4460 RepID=A0A843U8B0_COLES|nr:hypothetical protein [Colocasia esculenta]
MNRAYFFVQALLVSLIIESSRVFIEPNFELLVECIGSFATLGPAPRLQQQVAAEEPPAEMTRGGRRQGRAASATAGRRRGAAGRDDEGREEQGRAAGARRGFRAEKIWGKQTGEREARQSPGRVEKSEFRVPFTALILIDNNTDD